MTSKLFYVLIMFIGIGNSDSKAQNILFNKELITLTLGNFPESSYYKLLDPDPEIKFHIVSSKSIDGYCSTYCTSTYEFKREHITFVFKHDQDSTKCFLTDIFIKSKKAPFKTEDSITVGDKIPITRISKNIDELKEGASKRGDKYIDHLFCNNVNYYLKKTRVNRITSGTVVKVKKIVIWPNWVKA